MRTDEWLVPKLTAEFAEKSCRKRGFAMLHLRLWHERGSRMRWMPKVTKKLEMLTWLKFGHNALYVNFEVAHPGDGIGHIEAELTVEYGGLEVAHETLESKWVD